jgi:serine/threonine protein kinase
MKKERVFEAILDDQPVVVKFSRCYGQDAHILLAGKQLAPEIVCVETLAGGWRAVVMKKVIGEALPSTLDDITRSSLKEAVQTLHNAGIVHGDLRSQNILITECSKVCILDFDWADVVGKAHYPSDINMEQSCGWHDDVTPGGVIKIEHDLYQLNKLLHIAT